eukprot:CAMPEP_0196602004 /NCGR_PEP_ID=MMETSP1081-20130531/96203_1 /TAXON_ID=36882 /ORGANISM="Pyramimonas amylifera, Strain CCMP720" /LENGTH=235 /DNA_ID=CAMNT_0041927905 /DNA_START=445 /DNA_END=1152 /DNA_ORIENTATION=-
MSFDQQRDLRDLCFELRSEEQPGRELPPSAHTPLLALAEALFDNKDTQAAAKHAEEIPLPLYASRERAALAGRLLGAARYGAMFEETIDSNNDVYVVRLADAFKSAAVTISIGTTLETAINAALCPPRSKQLKIGPIEVNITAKQAAIGMSLSFTLAYAFERLASIYSSEASPDMVVATSVADNALIKEQLQHSFGDLTLIIGYSGTVLSTVVGTALLVIAAQLVEENFSEMENQ